MVDLSKNQILEPAIDCWYKNDVGKFVKGELLSIDHRAKIFPFTVRVIGDFEAIIYAEEVVLEDPYEPKQELMTREQVMGFIVNESGILVRCDSPEYSFEFTFPTFWGYDEDCIEKYDWVKVDKEGNFLTEPSKFWKTK